MESKILLVLLFAWSLDLTMQSINDCNFLEHNSVCPLMVENVIDIETGMNIFHCYMINLRIKFEPWQIILNLFYTLTTIFTKLYET